MGHIVEDHLAKPHASLTPTHCTRVGPVFRRAAATGPLSATGWLCVLLLVLAGGGLQAHANRTIDALFVAFLLLVAGLVLVSLVGNGNLKGDHFSVLR